MNIGQKIKNQRLLKKMTQEQLGDAIGVSKMMISKYERNIVDNMGREKIKALSIVLDIPIVDFLEASDENNDFDQITAKEFAADVIPKIKCVGNWSDEKKQIIINQIKSLCYDDDNNYE